MYEMQFVGTTSAVASSAAQPQRKKIQISGVSWHHYLIFSQHIHKTKFFCYFTAFVDHLNHHE